MYPIEYTWMRLPTPVTSSAKRIDSGSMSRPTLIVHEPVLIHVYSGTDTARCASGRPSRSAKRATATTKEAIGASVPM